MAYLNNIFKNSIYLVYMMAYFLVSDKPFFSLVLFLGLVLAYWLLQVNHTRVIGPLLWWLFLFCILFSPIHILTFVFLLVSNVKGKMFSNGYLYMTKDDLHVCHYVFNFHLVRTLNTREKRIAALKETLVSGLKDETINSEQTLKITTHSLMFNDLNLPLWITRDNEPLKPLTHLRRIFYILLIWMYKPLSIFKPKYSGLINKIDQVTYIIDCSVLSNNQA